MKVYRMNDGDCLKLCPILFKKKKVNYVECYGLYGHGLYIIDSSCEPSIKKFIEKVNQIEKLPEKLPWKFTRVKKYILGVSINNKPQLITVGQNIFDLIKDIVDISKVELNININQKFGFPDYSQSFIDIKPSNSSNPITLVIDEFLQGKGILNNREILLNCLGVDLVGEILAEMRDEKLDNLLG